MTSKSETARSPIRYKDRGDEMPLTIVSPTCEYRKEALGVGNPKPVVGWKLSGGNGARQTAYRIEVFDEDGRSVWDSGKVASDRQFGVEIEPVEPLRPMSEYSFAVTAWDESDAPSQPVSSRFVTGFFKAHQWRGDWLRIWHYGAVHFFRREFELKNVASVKYAYAFIGAFGDKGNSCVPFINGERIGDLPLFPGASEYFTAQYVCRDVKKMLKEGANAVGLMLARTASMIIKIKYESGEEIFIDCRRDEWKAAVGGGYKLGYDESMQHGKFEEFDAREAFAGWAEAGFDDSAWETAGEAHPIIDLAPLFLRPQLCAVKSGEEFSPVAITARGDGKLVDFGTNLAGFVTLRAKGKAGRTLTVRYAEKLDANGEPVYSDWRGAYNEYTFATDDTEEYVPCFMYTGFRYAGVYGDAEIETITARSIHSDVFDASRFECSDSAVNAIYETARRSFLSNLVNIPTDCPERERRGWTADAYAVCEAECAGFDVHVFYAQWLESMRDCRRGNGWIPVELPLSTDDCIDVNWPAAAVLIPYTLYEQYGDKRLIKRHLPMMKAWLALLEEICDEDYEIAECYMSYKDWIAAEPASPRFLSALYFYRCADLLSRLAEAVGERGDAEYCSALARRIREAINRKHLTVDGTDAYYDNGGQSANAHALYFGVCPQELRGAVTEHLVRDVEQKQTSTCGFMGTVCILEALSQNGRSDAAYRLIKNRSKGGWLYLIEECGATAFPEHFNGGGSQNHAFLGSSPALWVSKRLAGISPELPGYKRVRIEPYVPDDMDFASATTDTPYGCVTAGWRRDNGAVTLSVTLPPNVSGTVVFGGKTHEVGAGTHTFTA